MDTVYAVMTLCVGFGSVCMAMCALGWLYVGYDIRLQQARQAYMDRHVDSIARILTQKRTTTYKGNVDDNTKK